MGKSPISEFDTSELKFTDYLIFKIAKHELNKITRGSEIINNLEKSGTNYKISINYNGDNTYDPLNKKINWDPNRTMIAGDGKEISSISLLSHEMGHAEQDRIYKLPVSPSWQMRYEIENNNLKQNEKSIAEERNEGIRMYYEDWNFSLENGVIIEKNMDFIGPMTKGTYEFIKESINKYYKKYFF